ncbi:Type I Iterative Polyketide synthase (PKS), partial [Coccidioides immitis]
MAQDMQVFLFGDQTYDLVPDLRQLLRCNTKPILSAFLEQSHYVIRAQSATWLSPEEQQRSRSSNLAHLLQKYSDGDLNPAFQVALHSLTQLACFINHYEEPGRPYPSPGRKYVVGLCTGALAAAAISSSSSLSELLPAAVHTVQVALRLGLLANDMKDRIETPTQESPREWSAAFFDMTEAAAVSALVEFDSVTPVPCKLRPWIGATSSKAITISGPPSVLRRLIKGRALGQYKSRTLPIFLPSHTPQLFSIQDVEKVLEATNPVTWSRYNAKLPVLSGATGKSDWGGSFVSLLHRAVRECLMEPVRWDGVSDSVTKIARSLEVKCVAVTPVGTNLEHSMSSSLKDITKVQIEPLKSSDSPLFDTVPVGKAKLAIVGMSGRFPEAPTPEAFWDLLYEGLDVCKEVPAKRWDWRTHVTPDGKGHNLGGSKWGCWLDYADQFDPRFFSISPKEAPQMDPAQRMALMTTWEALEQSGFVSNTTPSTQNDRVGVFHGVTSNDYLECNSGQYIDTYFITGGNRGFIPGRINFCFEFCGPSYTNDTACSSSLAAIHLACNSLWRGDCDTAVAGGTNMCINPDGHTGLDKGFFLSRTGNCKPFDDQADGYCRGEGVATVIIKRLDDAIAENDPILAVILDAKTNHSALSESMTRPHVGAQVENMRAVLNTSGLDPRELSYVEMHGTGTQVGDAVEMQSVLNVFAPDNEFRGRDKPLYVGSAKANVGHGEGVSGITSLAKVLLMMKHDTIPPHCGIKPGSRINRNYPDLKARNVHIASEPVPWTRGSEPRRVLINNFSAAGGNTALLLEDAPLKPVLADKDPRSSHIVTVSGHVVASLKENAQRLIDFIGKSGSNEYSLSQLSWTTTARRAHHLFKIAVAGSTPMEVRQRLQEALASGDGTTRPKNKPKILFAFTGQGSQYIGMAKSLFHAFPSFRSDICNFDRLAHHTMGFPSFLHIITSNTGDMNDQSPVVVQLAIVSLEIALARLLQSLGVVPSAVVGHSLGEYAALHIAGVMTLFDTLYLVGRRAEFIQELCDRGTQAMLAIKASHSTIRKLLNGKAYEVACVNGPEDTVISAANDVIDGAKAVLNHNGIKSTVLQTPFAFHSAQVAPIMDLYTKTAEGVTFHKPSVPVLCPLTGKVVQEEGVFSAHYLVRHLREPVNMAAALGTAYESRVLDDSTFTIEIGPHPVVCGMVKATLGSQMPTLAILSRGKDVWPLMTEALAALYRQGYNIIWGVYHAPFKSSHRVVELPAYGWDLKEYWIPYENDWCIYKPYGRPGYAGHKAQSGNPIVLVDEPQSKTLPAPSVSIRKPQTTTIQTMISEDIHNTGATLVYEMDLNRPDASNVAGGHIVSNIPFTTPSVFADMAFVLGKYVVERFFKRPTVIDVANIVADKVLIPRGNGPQPIRVSMTMTWEPGQPQTLQAAQCEFYSVDAKGKTTARHSWCTVYFHDGTQRKKLASEVPLILSRIQRLRDGVDNGQFVRYNRASGYRLMSSVAHFHPDYKVLDDMVMDDETLEATCTLNFGLLSSGGCFAAHPAFVDCMTQLGGFTVNAQESLDLSAEVYISHGWDSLQIYDSFKAERKYQLYAQMKRDGSEFYHGDTCLLDGSTIIAYFKNVTVRRVSRKIHRAVMQTLVQRNTNAAASKGSADHKAAVHSPPVPKKPIAVSASKALPAVPSPTPKKAAELSAPKAMPAAAPLPVPLVAKTRNKKPAPQDTISEPQKKARNVPTEQRTISAGGARAKQKIAECLQVIAEESGIAVDDLTDDSNFADIGVDSLLSMVIASRFRENLGLDLDANFALFAECPTVKKLKEFIANFLGEPLETQASQLRDDNDERLQEIPPPDTKAMLDTSYSTPLEPIPAESSSSAPSTGHTSETLVEMPSFIKEDDSFLGVRAGGICSAGLAIVSEESGIAISDLTDETNFADIGVDSLLSMVIGSRFREELGLDLGADFSIFVNCPTVKKLKVFLNSHDASSEDDGSSDDAFGSSTSVSSMEEYADTKKAEFTQLLDDDCRPATSVILQGIPKLARKTLFLLPDGSGSASSYVPIPKLNRDVAIVGLNCPYVRDPENMNCTHTALLSSYYNEIRRRQPKGPYHLGGWSAGGGFAFACAELLIRDGEEVQSLIIIDSPLPQQMETLPVEFYEHCATLGLYGNEKPPSYLIPHFLRTLETMLPYQATPLKTRRLPKVGILWACETVMDAAGAPDIGERNHFMLRRRQDFGPDGWDTVLPGAEFVLGKAVGANHFTMMQKDHNQHIARLIEKVV